MRAEQFRDEVWNEEDYSITLFERLSDAMNLGIEGEQGQDIDYSMELKVLSYGARAALADFTAEEDSEHPYEMEFYGHTFYSAFSGMERIELKKVAEYDGW